MARVQPPQVHTNNVNATLTYLARFHYQLAGVVEIDVQLVSRVNNSQPNGLGFRPVCADSGAMDRKTAGLVCRAMGKRDVADVYVEERQDNVNYYGALVCPPHALELRECAVTVQPGSCATVAAVACLEPLFASVEIQTGKGVLFPYAPVVIATELIGGEAVYAADMDGDGDLDVLSASAQDNKIAWYENVGGQGAFPASHHRVITTSTSYAVSVYAADIDGDGDMDVLSASYHDAKIVWYENVDGRGAFPQSNHHVISTTASGAWSVFAADLDGDNDTDVISATRNDNKVTWYENVGGDGSFPTSHHHVITTSAIGAMSVCAADLDGDGDFDILSASTSLDGKTGIITLYENVGGNGSFPASNHRVIVSTDVHQLTLYTVHASDMDLDGDIDFLWTAYNVIEWIENADGKGDFPLSRRHLVTKSAAAAVWAHAADIDGDGDVDVLGALFGNNRIVLYENSNGTFAETNITKTITRSIHAVHAADLDNDGDLDVLGIYDDGVEWIENKHSDFSTSLAPNWFTELASTLPHVHTLTWESLYSVIVPRENDVAGAIAADLNGDGAQNILSWSTLRNKILFWNTDPGAAQATTVSSEFPSPVTVIASDLDNDNDLDILAASLSNRSLVWFNNTDSLGNFSANWTVIAIDVANITAIVTADLDGDGAPDVLWASFGNGTISWHRNNGHGAFSGASVITNDAAQAMVSV